MRFEKWQALGNDYLIVEHDQLPFAPTPARVRRLCEGHFGVCADGVLLLSRTPDPAHVAQLRIFNPDGSEAELSGNGVREAVLYLRRRGWTAQDSFSILTRAGEIRPRIVAPDTCTVDMGRAKLVSADFPGGPPNGLGELEARGDGDRTRWRFRHVSIGNPQCAIAVAEVNMLEALDLAAVGPSIESNRRFPNRTNVSWYAQLDAGPPARIRARIFERGVGETLSSGTGATGAAISYVLDARERDDGDQRTHAGQAPRAGEGRERVTVVLDGGELTVDIGQELEVNLTGWARAVYAGHLSEEFVKELEGVTDESE